MKKKLPIIIFDLGVLAIQESIGVISPFERAFKEKILVKLYKEKALLKQLTSNISIN